jgi:hypothetical protein
MLSHLCYSAQPFLLQWLSILENSVIPHCYSAQPFLVQCSVILAIVLSHFLLSDSAQPFLLQWSIILATMLSHSSCYIAQLFSNEL